LIKFTVQQICNQINGVLLGNTSFEITHPNQIEEAQQTEITFIGSKKFAHLWPTTNAAAVVVNEDIELISIENKAIIKVKSADMAMAKILEMFLPETICWEADIHISAVIHPSAKIGAGVKIGAGSYVGKDVIIGDNTILYPNVTIFDTVKIGANTNIWSGCVIRERSVIGSYCILHPNVSIGADGFGFLPSADGKGLLKIIHIGNVVIGNGVEIGANSCVDRGKFGATTIGDGCKIDNLVQIGHNSKMGRCCIMAGASGLAGSVTLGDGVVIGGGACISDHVTLGNGVQVGGQSGVINNYPAGAKVLGYPAIDSRDALKQWVLLRKMVKETK
jgi:UDP-3-O-[3-hydroxymyristoyl] glucosamine N-acyltransferase